MKKILFFIFILFIFSNVAYGATFDNSVYDVGDNPVITFDNGAGGFGMLFLGSGGIVAGCFEDGSGTVPILGPTTYCDTLYEPFDLHPLQNDGLESDTKYDFIEFDYDTYGSIYTDCYDGLSLPIAGVVLNDCIEYLNTATPGGYPYILSTFDYGAVFIKIGSGFYFFGENSNTPADQTASNLTANVSDGTSSVFPIAILALSVFLAFYVMQKVIMFFGYAYRGEKAPIGRRKNRR